MIGVVDYGLGNIQAFLNIFKNLNIAAMAVHDCDQLSRADKLILPGVGSFDWAMEKLIASGMRECLHDLVINQHRYILGVCVGMQMMACSSEEGRLPGLGWISGEVKKLTVLEDADVRTRGGEMSLPHMGWNDVMPRGCVCLFQGIDAPRFYFLHSYYFAATRADDVLATTDYHGVFASAVRAGNVFGTQFHPEKSHGWGIQLLKTFAEV